MKREYGMFEFRDGKRQQVHPEVHGRKDYMVRVAQNWLLAPLLGEVAFVKRELRPLSQPVNLPVEF